LLGWAPGLHAHLGGRGRPDPRHVDEIHFGANEGPETARISAHFAALPVALAGSRVGGPLRKVVAQVFVLPKKDERPGVNVMILKYFRRKKIAKNWRFQLTTATN
jgi:hypothetical protein